MILILSLLQINCIRGKFWKISVSRESVRKMSISTIGCSGKESSWIILYFRVMRSDLGNLRLWEKILSLIRSCPVIPIVFSIASIIGIIRQKSQGLQPAALKRLFMQIIKTKWDFYDSEYKLQASKTALQMKDMLIDEYKQNKSISLMSRSLFFMLLRSRSLYWVSTKMKGTLQRLVNKMS